MAVSMAKQQGLPPSQRFLLNINDAKQKREKGARQQKKAHEDDIHRLGSEALPPPADSEATTPGASGPTLPLTPPVSPVSSRNRTERAPSLAESTEEIVRLRKSLEDRQSRINLLTVELGKTEDEVRRLREERREASNEHIYAVSEDRGEDIEKCRRREEKLVRMLKDKELFIKELETSIDEGRERKQDLRKKLVEAERRIEVSEQRFREEGNHVNQHKNTRAEGKKTVQKVGSAGPGRNRLEIRRHKGDSITPVRAIYQVVAKGASFEKAAAL